MSQPWYREVSRQQWKTFLTTFAAWTLDAFDFTILTFVLIDIQQSFTVNKALAGALGTVTLFFRVFGGIGAGTLADRFGRKGPILFSIAWYTTFALLSGMSTSYVMLFAMRGLFGIGMGGMWAAGMPLALEQWPAKHRGLASGILQGGYSTGFLLSSIVYQLAYPLVSDRPEWAWRFMLWAGVVPAMIVFGLMWRVPESPVWLEDQRRQVAAGGIRRLSLARLFDKDLQWVTLHTSLLMGAFVFMYQSSTFWYPTLLTQLQQKPLAFLVLLNLGGSVGSGAFGYLSEKIGRRGSATVGVVGGLLSVHVPVFNELCGTAGRSGDFWDDVDRRMGNGSGVSRRAISDRCARRRHGVRLSPRGWPRRLVALPRGHVAGWRHGSAQGHVDVHRRRRHVDPVAVVDGPRDPGPRTQ